MTAGEPDGETGESPTLTSTDSRAILVDLVAVLAITVATVAVATVPGLDVPGVRVVLGALFVLFVPGYATVSALFPERQSGGVAGATPVQSGGVSGVERIALSLGISVALVPLLALLINFSPSRLDLVTVLAILGGYTVVTTLVAVRRRLSLVPRRQFRVPYRRWGRGTRRRFSTGSAVEAVPIAIIVVSLLVAGTGVAQTVVFPQDAETYTEFYLLSGEEDGIGQATNYTTDLEGSEEHSVVVGIGNHERASVDYTVVVRLQQMRVQGNVSTPVESEELTRFGTTVAPGGTAERRVAFTPTLTGERLRLQFLLYAGGAPSDPSADSAYRETHLWVSVS